MSNSEIQSLRRAIRNTRLGGLLGLAIMGGSLAYGVHHLGERHHEVFQEFYLKHKKTDDSPPNQMIPSNVRPNTKRSSDVSVAISSVVTRDQKNSQ
jgi:hypothetical protein